ncbi:MAG: hypothetical protein HND48_19845 [Chloroflexi bacterium]|nr:hypothetical protein [Chloroflexota bacterium]
MARSRNDLGYALTRLSLRPLILTAIRHLHELRRALLDFAEAHLETLMPGYTHTQPPRSRRLWPITSLGCAPAWNATLRGCSRRTGSTIRVRSARRR